MPTFRAFRTLLLAALLSAPAALAAPPGAAPRPGSPGPALRTPGPRGCNPRSGGAISEIARKLSGALGALPARALVVAAPVESKIKLTNPGALVKRIVRVVTGAIGHQARSHDMPAGLGRARSLAAKAGTLLYLEPRVARGQLQVTADVYPVARDFWDRARDPAPSPTRHAFASHRIDAEVRSFLPPVRLVVSHVDKANSPERDPVALACGDVQGDGVLELVLVGRHAIHVGRLRTGRLVPRASVDWSALSPVAPFPLRQPLGAVSIEDGHIDVGLSDRAEEVRLDPDLKLIGRAPRRVPWAPGGCVPFAGVALAEHIEPCFPGDAAIVLRGFQSRADAIAGALIVERDGRAHRVRAARIANGSVALLRDDRGRRARVEGVGAQLAVGDLDGDGQPELLSGTNTLDPRADALVVDTWLDSGRVVERFRLAVPGGVRALAVCPPEDDGLAPVAIATGDQIWIVR